MKRKLLTVLNLFSFSTLVTYIGNPVNFNGKLKFLLILILSIFYTSSKAQTLVHAVPTSNPSFPLPVGMDVVTVEAWGAGGAGGAANPTLGVGRSGGGGGGGAYSRGTITITGLSSLNVVVGTTASGGTNNGVSGGDSYITGFTSAFNAPGGKGGNANIVTTSTPTGGTGGTGAIGNLVTANGVDGGPGGNALLGALLTSGAGGNAGNFGAGLGGAGGAARSTVVLATNVGNPGNIYGGGGGGAISASTLQNGGSGARGHVNITYTCKTYSFATISAANVCTTTGTTSQVQLTGTSTTLPAGTYTVTYNISSPALTGLTATMTVESNGVGSFTAVGLSVLGTSIITVTSLTSVDCTSTISTNNSVNIVVAAQPTLTLGTMTAVCASSNLQSNTLSYSNVTNMPSTYSITWNASPTNSFLPVTNASLTASPISISIPANTPAGTYTGNLTVANTAGCISPIYSFTVTVNPLPAITLGNIAGVCTSASLQNVALPYTAPTNSPTTYSIAWNASPTNNFLAVTDAALTSSPISIAVPAGTAAGAYTGALTVKNANGCVSMPSNFTITVNSLPSITLGTAGAVCFSASAQTTNLNYTATTNSPNTYSITWNASPTNTFASVTNASLPASPISIAIPANTATGTYTGTLTVRNAAGCTSTASNFTVTVSGPPTITLTGTTPVCFNASAQTAILNYTATTNSPNTYSITWNSSPTNSFAAVTNATLTASPISIAVPAGTAAGTYTGNIIVKNATGCTSSGTNFTVTVNPLPTISLSATTAVCISSSAQSTTLPYTAVTNAPTNYSITWNASPTNTFTAVSNASLPASPINIPIPANTAAGTYTGTLTVSNANGCVSTATNFTVTVNALPTITLGATTAVCTNSVAQSTTLPYTAVTNSPTNYSIIWNSSPTNTFAPVTNASLPTSPINIPIPANTAPGAYTGTITVSNTNGCISTATNFTVIVNPLPAITLGATTAVCASSNPQSTTLPYSASTNSPTNYSITWNASPTNTFAPVTNSSLPAGPITIPIPANTAAGIYTGTLTVSNANGCVSTAANFTVTVNAVPTITLGTATPVCFNASAQTANLSYTATTNSPTNYSITWNASPTNSFLAVTNATLTTSPISIAVPAGTAAGTYTGTLTVSNASGCVSTANNFTVTVNPLPTITLGATASVCESSVTQSTALPYIAVTNSPTTYSITWNASPTNSFATVTDEALTASPITVAIPAGTASGTYTGTLTVMNANGCLSVDNVFTVTINEVPTITTSGNLISICQDASAQIASLPYSATTGSPINYSIDWAALNDQATTTFSFDSGGGNIDNINVPAGTAAGTYTGVMTISTSNGCLTTQAISLTINTLPTISTAGAFASVCQSPSEQTTKLAYNATTGSPTSYAIDWITLTDQGATPFPFSSGSGNIINVIVPANTASGTYSGIMTITTSNGCSATQSVSLTVNAVAAAPTASVTQLPTCLNNTGVITVTSPASGTGYTYSIDGVDFSNTSGIFAGLSSGGYNVQVKNSTTGCESEATPIMINAFVTKAWNGSVDANWGNPANWTPAGVPIASDCVDIPDVGVDPIISGTNASFFVSRLTVQNNGSLIVQGTNTITVTNEVSVLGNGILTFENNSSLVQINDIDNTGNIIYKRNTTPVRRYDVTYWSSPVTRVPAFTLHDLSPNTLWDKYHKFNSATEKWILISNGAEEMVKGNGYSIRSPQFYDLNSTQIFGGQFVGTPNNGTIIGPPVAAEKLVLLGNPYPSAIYADQFIHDNADRLYGTLYFWTHNSPPTLIPGTNTYTYTGSDFAYYNLSGLTEIGTMEGTGATSPGNQSEPAGYIAAGQGFFAKSRTGQNPVYTNSMRVASNNSQFFKSANTALIEKHRVWLNFTNTEGAFKQLLIGYVTGATNSFDYNYDAVTLNANPYVDFYSINEGKKLVIQGRALPFVVSDTIPLGYKSTIPEGNFTIAIDHTDGNLSNQNIYLQDNVTNTIHNLKTGGYTFRSAPGTFLNRFVLRYTNSDDDKELGNEDFENQNQKIVVSVKDKNIKLQSISEQENLQEVSIYDVGGKLLYHKKEIGNKDWIINNFQSGPQILFVKITLENGKTASRKIVFR